MGIFTSKKAAPAKAEKAVAKAAPKKAIAPSVAAVPAAAHHIIYRARITEKSAFGSEKGIYTFDISKEATKPMVSLAIQALYKVTPAAVNIVNIPRKQVFIRGKRGMKQAIKKAYVTLKKGDKIEIV